MTTLTILDNILCELKSQLNSINPDSIEDVVKMERDAYTSFKKYISYIDEHKCLYCYNKRRELYTLCEYHLQNIPKN